VRLPDAGNRHLDLFPSRILGHLGLSLADSQDSPHRYPYNPEFPISTLRLGKIIHLLPYRLKPRSPRPLWGGIAARVGRSARVNVNSQAVSGVRPGSYLGLQREWKNGDTINLDLDISLHYWAGARECDGKTSIYHGPLLLAFDPVYNPMDPEDVPELDARKLNPQFEKTDRRFQPWVLVKVKATNGQDVTLCDFATAGAYGNHYRTWLPIKNVAPLAFDPSQPVWNNRPR
jgi:hypothetical protein